VNEQRIAHLRPGESDFFLLGAVHVIDFLDQGCRAAAAVLGSQSGVLWMK
jgi:hypothetical protein